MTRSASRCIRSGRANAAGIRAAGTCAPASACTIPRISIRRCPSRPLPSPYYRARRAFDHLLRSPEFEIRFLLAADELLTMDNRRLLHGRTGFDPAEGVRHLQSCYIDIDGPRTLYRVVRRWLAAENEA